MSRCCRCSPNCSSRCSASADEIGIDAVAEVGPGGHFFAAAHTMQRYRDAFYTPLVSDWRNFGAWTDGGAKTATERAGIVWRETLAAFQPPPMDPAVLEKLSDVRRAPAQRRRRPAGVLARAERGHRGTGRSWRPRSRENHQAAAVDDAEPHRQRDTAWVGGVVIRIGYVELMSGTKSMAVSAGRGASDLSILTEVARPLASMANPTSTRPVSCFCFAFAGYQSMLPVYWARGSLRMTGAGGVAFGAAGALLAPAFAAGAGGALTHDCSSATQRHAAAMTIIARAAPELLKPLHLTASILRRILPLSPRLRKVQGRSRPPRLLAGLFLWNLGTAPARFREADRNGLLAEVTFLPEVPLRNVPLLRFFMAVSTLSEAALPYLAIAFSSVFASDECVVGWSSPVSERNVSARRKPPRGYARRLGCERVRCDSGRFWRRLRFGCLARFRAGASGRWTPPA